MMQARAWPDARMLKTAPIFRHRAISRIGKGQRIAFKVARLWPPFNIKRWQSRGDKYIRI